MPRESNQKHVVHLPVYRENAYQPGLMESQEKLGWRVTDGGGGGNFIRTALRTWKPDILHVHWLHPYLLRDSTSGSWLRGMRFLAEIALLRRKGAKIAWTVHNLKNHDARHESTELRLSRLFVKQVDLVIAHGQFAVEAAKERFRIPPRVDLLSVRFPNYTERYPSTMTVEESEEHWGTKGSGITFGFLGRVEPYKQVTELVQAFRACARDKDQLLIGGRASSDEYAAEIRKAIGNDSRIRFANNYIAEDLIASFLSAVDVAACPSRGILTSSSVPLAMSFSKPAIAPQEGCIPEELGDAGFLYDGSQTGLENAIKQAIDQKDQLSDLGRRALARAEQASPAMIAQQIIDGYERVL